MVSSIDARDHPATIDLGFLLLQLDADSIKGLSRTIDRITSQTRQDAQPHDMTVALGSQSTGLTVHCNQLSDDEAKERLGGRCALRKHSQKAARWLGISLRPEDAGIRFGVSMEYPWQPNEHVDEMLRQMPKARPAAEVFRKQSRRAKVGRNAPCICGSGIKFKRCCGR